MSRRHHGRPHHGRHRGDSPRPDAGAARPAVPAPDVTPTRSNAPVTPAVSAETQPAKSENGANGSDGASWAHREPAAPASASHVNGQPNGHADGQAQGTGNGAMNGADRPAGCTAPQLRRFIKSRPYVPMHELRRRFAIDGNDDDVTQVELDGSHVYVGLPAREGSLLGELLRGGEIGYELSFDPLAPIVVGVYPMRPVPRN